MFFGSNAKCKYENFNNNYYMTALDVLLVSCKDNHELQSKLSAYLSQAGAW